MNKITYLDGLRGFAAFIVVLNHFIVAFYPALYTHQLSDTHIGDGTMELFISNSPFNLFFAGNFAVCIFFTLSGIVLSQKYFLTHDTQILKEYALKRYPRLFFPVLFTVIIVFLLIKFSLFYNVEASQITKSIWLSKLWNFDPSILKVLNSSFIGIFFLRDTSFNTVFWTMQIELMGSFLVFALLYLSNRIQKDYLVYLLLAIFFIKVERYFYISFMAGLMMAKAMSGKEFPSFNTALKIIMLGAGLFLGSFPCIPNSNSLYGYLDIPMIKDCYELYHVIASVLILITVLSSKTLQRFFDNKVNLYLGKISFSMYLLHVPLIGSLSCYIFLLSNQYMAYHLSVLVSFILSLSVIIISSHYFHLNIDANSIAISNGLINRTKARFNFFNR